MKKEIVICLVIIVSVIIGDILLQQFTDKSLSKINDKISLLKEEILETGIFDMEKINNINDEWEDNFKILTCYLEHDELEKVKTQIVIISSGMKASDKEFVIEELDRAIYIINHIEAKQKFRIDNIF